MFAINYDEVEEKSIKYLNTRDTWLTDILLSVINLVKDTSAQFYNINWIKDPSFTKFDIPLKIFDENPLKLGNMIANHIYSKIETVKLSTVIPYEEFIIFINTRRIIELYKFDKFSNVFSPIMIKLNKIPVKILSMEITLCNLFHELYYPDPSIWEESKINDALDIFLPDTKIKIDGGVSSKILKKKLYESLSILDYQIILVGYWALYAMEMCDEPKSDKIQFISDLDPKVIRDVIKKVYKYDVTFRKEKLHLIHDYWTTRTIFYIHIDDKRIPIVDVFNSTTWEMVPYIRIKGIEIGTSFVLCRFLLIDIWTITMLKNREKITQTRYDSLCKRYIIYLKKLIKNPNNSDEYYGKFNDVSVLKKLLISSNNKVFYPYYPHWHKKENGSTRKI